MKVRLAKKIMKQEPNPMHKASLYWFDRWVDYWFYGVSEDRLDHRITKAIKITSKHDRRSI